MNSLLIQPVYVYTCLILTLTQRGLICFIGFVGLFLLAVSKLVLVKAWEQKSLFAENITLALN